MEYVRHVRHSCLFYRWEDVCKDNMFVLVFYLCSRCYLGMGHNLLRIITTFWGDQHLFLQLFLGTPGRLLTHPFRPPQEGPTEFNEQYPTASERPWVDIGLVRQGCGVTILEITGKDGGNPWKSMDGIEVFTGYASING